MASATSFDDDKRPHALGANAESEGRSFSVGPVENRLKRRRFAFAAPCGRFLYAFPLALFSKFLHIPLQTSRRTRPRFNEEARELDAPTAGTSMKFNKKNKNLPKRSQAKFNL